MSTPTTPTELSLINGNEFLEELERLDQAIGGETQRSEPSRPLFDDNYASLDRGLPVWDAAPDFRQPVYVDEPPPAPPVPHDRPRPVSAAADAPRVSMVMAAIVIAASLTAGAATAAYVFQDSLTRITALRSASR